MVVASFTREMAAQSFAYHAHRTADSDKPAVIRGLCAMTKHYINQHESLGMRLGASLSACLMNL